MQNKINFLKMEGIGNDFVVIDAIAEKLPFNLSKIAKVICHRRFGIGCDQILLLEKSEQAAAKMIIYNADGSLAEMCGNGLRCVARYLLEKENKNDGEISLETAAGIHLAKMEKNQVSVIVFEPAAAEKAIEVQAKDKIFKGFPISIGNPHFVIIAEDDIEQLAKEYGAIIERDKVFANRSNVGFVSLIDKQTIDLVVWERGSGITLACGSGACAAAVVAIREELAKSPVNVNLPGGKLIVEWNEGEKVRLTGAARTVFQGSFSPEEFLSFNL